MEKKITHNSTQRCQAVLSVWTEKRRPSEVCREMSIKGAVLNHWQNRALEGMLQALEPRVNLDKGPALSPRLQKMIARRTRTEIKQTVMMPRLENKLEKVQEKVKKNASKK